MSKLRILIHLGPEASVPRAEIEALKAHEGLSVQLHETMQITGQTTRQGMIKRPIVGAPLRWVRSRLAPFDRRMLQTSPDGVVTALIYRMWRKATGVARHPHAGFHELLTKTPRATEEPDYDLIILCDPTRDISDLVTFWQTLGFTGAKVAIHGATETPGSASETDAIRHYVADTPIMTIIDDLGDTCPTVKPDPSGEGYVIVVADKHLLTEPAGNATVLDRQLKYLADRSGKAILVVLRHQTQDQFSEYEDAFLKSHDITAILEIDMSILGARRSYGALGAKGLGAFGLTIERYRHAMTNPFFAELCETRNIKYALVNYCWALQIFEGVAQDFPLICETHDIQSRQWAVQNHRSVHPGDLTAELGLLSKADSLIAISNSEQDFLSSELSPDKVYCNIGGFVLPESHQPALQSPTLRSAWEAAGAKNAPVPQLTDERLDIFFVGHSNFHNENAVVWLVNEILPKLDGTVQLGIAGAVCAMPKVTPFRGQDRVQLLGIVDDLDPLYAAATVVAVPLLSGEGTSIKTVEAMARGKAIAATPAGLRGLSDIDYPRAEGSEEYARLLHNLLIDADYRAQIEKQSLTHAKYFGTDAYFGRFDKIIEGTMKAYKQTG